MKTSTQMAAPLPWKPLFQNPRFVWSTAVAGVVLAAGVYFAHDWKDIVGHGTVAAMIYALYAVFPSAVDFKVQRLPNVFTLTSSLIAILYAAAATYIEQDWWVLGRALIAGFIVFGSWFLLAVIANVGWGDVKFSFAGGVLLGAAGWPALIAGAGVWMAVIMFLAGMVALMSGKKGKDTIPQGPSIALATLLGLAFPLMLAS